MQTVKLEMHVTDETARALLDSLGQDKDVDLNGSTSKLADASQILGLVKRHRPEDGYITYEIVPCHRFDASQEVSAR